MERMLKNKNIIAIIPARGGSKGIPGKNIIDFCGKPLITWSIEQALNSRYIKKVFVSSNDKEILLVAKNSGTEIINRPKELATDTSSTEEALMHAIRYINKIKEAKVHCVVFLQCTSPVRTSQDIDNAIRTFISTKADSLFSASLLEDFCIWEIKNNKYSSLTYDYKNRGRRQDRKPYYLENGSIYVFKTEVLKKYKNRLGGKIVTYLMPAWKSHEIDTQKDIEVCEYYMKEKILNAASKDSHIKVREIELIVYDFDGVLTDNKVIINEDGLESVTVNRADGLAIDLIKKRGIKQVILTTETNNVTKRRAEKLDLPIMHSVKDKKETLSAYCEKNGINLQKTIYIGNDINDLEAMKISGCPLCPSDASEKIKKISKTVLNAAGGAGVARALAEYLGITK